MAKDENKKLSPKQLSDDRKALEALKVMKEYNPSNKLYVLKNVQAAYSEMERLRELRTQAEKALDTARDREVAAEWRFHNNILGVKDQVTAQYGDDSPEIQSLGLKRKSEHKRPRKNNDPGSANK